MSLLKISTALSLACLAIGMTAAQAGAAEREFALVFKVLNNAFSPPIEEGCQAAAKELGDVTCTYIGPTEYDEAKQVQLAQDMVTRGVAGLGISAGNPKAMARIMKMAQEKGIPVVTYDTDVLPEDAGLRSTYIGTDNYEFGVALGPEGAGAQEERRHRLHPIRRPGFGKPQGPCPGHPRHLGRVDERQARRSP